MPERIAATVRAGLSAGLLCLVTVGCTSSSPSSAALSPTSAATSAATSAPTSSASAGLTLVDGWAKAAPTGMTALFGTLRNTGPAPVEVISGSTSLAQRVELHEVVMVDGVPTMRQRRSGLVVPPGGSLTLAPGGNHVMLVGLVAPVRVGDDVVVTLRLSTGADVVVHALGKDFAGAKESYQPSASTLSGTG